MSTAFISSPAGSSSVSGVASVPPWKLDELKDVSPGGICEIGYGNKNKARRTLQYVSDIKHKEKYSVYFGWGVAFIPALLDALPEILYTSSGPAPLHAIPRRAHAALKKKFGKISNKQLAFLLSVIPLYRNTRAIKNAVWVGSGLDPSGHTMYKIAQYGMMLSIATDHGKKTSIKRSILYYVGIMAAADAIMLANTFTNCHTLTEVIVGGGLGVAILIAAHLISKYTPLGKWARSIANAASEIVATAGRNLAKSGTWSLNSATG